MGTGFLLIVVMIEIAQWISKETIEFAWSIQGCIVRFKSLRICTANFAEGSGEGTR